MEQKIVGDSPKDPLKELEAMRKIVEALSTVDAESGRRVLRWASELFGEPPPTGRATHDRTGPVGETTELADLFAAVQPTSGPEKALLAAYWLQEIKKSEDIEAQTLNSHLKHLGHALPNVTATMSLLMHQQPALIVQTRKQGSSKQARKLYRITAEGQRRIKQLLSEISNAALKDPPR